MALSGRPATPGSDGIASCLDGNSAARTVRTHPLAHTRRIDRSGFAIPRRNPHAGPFARTCNVSGRWFCHRWRRTLPGQHRPNRPSRRLLAGPDGIDPRLSPGSRRQHDRLSGSRPGHHHRPRADAQPLSARLIGPGAELNLMQPQPAATVVILPFHDRAFKEWAVACEAMMRGIQTVLIRKGGIREEDGIFRVADSEFFLMPTYEHQNPALLRDGYKPLLE